MLELIIVILLLLWLFGYFGRTRFRGNNLIHVILIIVVILILFRFLR